MGAVATPPPFEQFDTAKAGTPSDEEHVETCMGLMVMQVNFELGVLQRQLGVVHPDIEIWIVNAINALNRTKGEPGTDSLPLNTRANIHQRVPVGGRAIVHGR